MRRRAVALQSVLAMGAVLSIIALSVVSLFLASLNYTQMCNNGDLAQAEAEAALGKLLGHLSETSDFAQPIRGTVTPGLDPREAYHKVVWSAESDCPASLNNMDGSLVGKPAGVHAYCLGYCKGQYRTLEVTLTPPSFPYAIATNGPIRSDGDLTIQGTSGKMEGDLPVLDRPGSLASNAPLGTSVELKNGSVIVQGFVRCPGGVRAPAGAIKGGLQTGSVDLPEMTFDTILAAADGALPPAVLIREENPRITNSENTVWQFNGYRKRQGNLSLQEPVQLINGLLEVRGNLQLRAGVHGRGVIYADGDVRIQASDFRETDSVTVIAGGDVKVVGSSMDVNRQAFRGLLYARGNLDLEHAVVYGALIGKPADGSYDKGAVLKNAGVIQTTSVGVNEIEVQGPGGVTLGEDRVPFNIEGPAGSTYGRNDRGDRVPELSGVVLRRALEQIVQNVVNGILDPNQPWTPEKVADSFGDPNASNGPQGDARAVGDTFASLSGTAVQLAELSQKIKQQQSNMPPAEIPDPTPDDPGRMGPNPAYATAQQRIQAWTEERETLLQTFSVAADNAIKDYMNYFGARTQGDGLINPDTVTQPTPIKFNVNSVLPKSVGFRVAYWKMHRRRLP